MSRTLLIASLAVVAFVAIALAAPEPKDKKSHSVHHHGRPHKHDAKSRKPRSAELAAYVPHYESGDDNYPIDYQPDDYYGQFEQFGRRLRGFRSRGPGRVSGGRRGLGRPRAGPASFPQHDYPLYPYQYLYPNYPQYIENDSDYDRKKRVKKDADKRRVKKAASSLLEKINSVFKSVKQ